MDYLRKSFANVSYEEIEIGDKAGSSTLNKFQMDCVMEILKNDYFLRMFQRYKFFKINTIGYSFTFDTMSVTKSEDSNTGYVNAVGGVNKFFTNIPMYMTSNLYHDPTTVHWSDFDQMTHMKKTIIGSKKPITLKYNVPNSLRRYYDCSAFKDVTSTTKLADMFKKLSFIADFPCMDEIYGSSVDFKTAFPECLLNNKEWLVKFMMKRTMFIDVTFKYFQMEPRTFNLNRVLGNDIIATVIDKK